MRKLFFPLFMVFGFVLMQNSASAQCPVVTTSSIVASNDTVLPCGGTACATLRVLSANTTLRSTNTYSVSSTPYAPEAYNAGTLLSALSDDVYSSVKTLPFSFCFFGNKYTQCVIGSNANVSFNTSLAGAYDPWPISGPLPGSAGDATHNAIMFPWMDFLNTSGGGIYYNTYGTAPCRHWVVSYNNVAFFSCTSTHASVEMIIYESTNVIEVYMLTKPICSGWNDGLAVTGISNNAGSTFYTAPGENGTAFTATNQGWRFTPNGTPTWNYTWYSSMSPLTAVATGVTATVCPATTHMYYVKGVATSNCDSVVVWDSVLVTTGAGVDPITGTTSVCLGTNSTLSETTTGGTWSSSNTSVATINASGVVTSVGVGVTTISYSLPSGCVMTANFAVNPVPALSGTTTICAGGTSPISSTVTTGTWSSSNTSVASVNTSGVVTGVAPGSCVITFMSSAGCSATIPINVVVLSSITGTPVVCMGSTTALANSASGGNWTSSNTTVASVDALSGVVTGVAGGTAGITYTTGGGCYAAIVVTVNPITPITGVMSTCQYHTTTLSNSIPGGTWSSSNTSVATVDPTSGVVYGATGGTSTIKYTFPTGCITTAIVAINPKPGAPTVTPPHICQTVPASPLVATSTGTVTWYGPGTTAGYTTAPTPDVTSAGVITYYATTTSAYGCVSDSTTIPVTITPKPAAPVPHTISYCQGFTGATPLNYQVDSAYGSNLNWFTAGGTAISVPTPPTDIATYPTGTSWLVSQTVSQCTSDQATETAIIIPTPSFSIVNRDWVCQYDSMVFSYTPGGPIVDPVYTWTLPDGASAVNGTSVSGASVDIRFDEAVHNHYPVTLTIGNLGGQCVHSETKLIRVVPQPTATTYAKSDICVGDTIRLALSGISSNAYSYTWLIDGQDMFTTNITNIVTANSNTGGPYSISFNQSGRHIITVGTATEEGCKSIPTNDSVNVHALPDATIAPLITIDLNGTSDYNKNDGHLCTGDSVLLQPKTYKEENSYVWAPDRFFGQSNKQYVYSRILYATDVKLTVTDPFGCTSADSMYIDAQPCCTVTFPTAFTPNGDGRNDVFRPITLGSHKVHSFRVVNRWGQVVYEAATEKCQWDGTFGGVPQDMGVYYYFIKYDCDNRTIEEKGEVTLVR